MIHAILRISSLVYVNVDRVGKQHFLNVTLYYTYISRP